MFDRRKTRQVKVGNLSIGGNAPITIQSMTNTDTRDIPSTIEQIKRLEAAGCEIVRLAVPDLAAADALKEIKKNVSIPLVADIHFDYRLALASLESGVDKLRLNPGNIGGQDRVRQVVTAAKERNVPIRIGVNGGSLDRDILSKYGHPSPEALVESALQHLGYLDELNFSDVILAIKSSDVPNTIKAYRLLAEETDCPFHIGITESGTKEGGTVKSSVGIGILLSEGLGDTLRVSLTGDPVEEIRVGRTILQSLGLRESGVKVISCPTCGRCHLDLEPIALEIEKRVANLDKTMTVAIMGCAVNGPGEAREADIGIAGGNGEGLLFKKGEIIRKLKSDEIVEVLMDEIMRY